MENLLLQKISQINTKLNGELCIKSISRNRWVFYKKSDKLYLTDPLSFPLCMSFLTGIITYIKLRELQVLSDLKNS